MKKYFRLSAIILPLTLVIYLLLFNNYSVFYFLEKQFEDHVSNAETILTDNDPFHPKYAFTTEDKVIGFKFNDGWECGRIYKRIYLNNDKIKKIIIRNYNDGGDKSCELYDTIYIIEPDIEKIKLYVNFKPAKSIINKKLIEEEVTEVAKYIREVNGWKIH